MRRTGLDYEGWLYNREAGGSESEKEGSQVPSDARKGSGPRSAGGPYTLEKAGKWCPELPEEASWRSGPVVSAAGARRGRRGLRALYLFGLKQRLLLTPGL